MQIKNIVIKDNAASDVTFVASRPQGGETSPALWVVKTGNRALQERLTALVRRSGSNSGFKTTIDYIVPLADSVDPSVKKAQVQASLTFTTPDYITDAQAANFAVKFKNLVANADIQLILQQEPAL